MKNALREISAIRKEEKFNIKLDKSNAHCIIVNETDGNTAYCFSSYICHINNGEFVQRKFKKQEDAYVFTGSDSNVSLHDGLVIMKNQYATASISLPIDDIYLEDGILKNAHCKIQPTFNGFMMYIDRSCARLQIRTDNPNFEAKYCKKYFALMQENFKPFITVSPIVSFDVAGAAIPAEINYFSENRRYELEIFSKTGCELMFEVNMYQRKLIQDTTVENKNPSENNVFGGSAFLGDTKWFGEQWLYMRLDQTYFSFFQHKRISKMLLHIPCLYNNQKHILMYASSARFCSFGSTWANKKDINEFFAVSRSNGNYITFDITEIYNKNPQILFTNGIVLRYGDTSDSYVVIATGDNVAYSPIIEIQIKN